MPKPPPPDNLGQRQYDLNARVNNAFDPNSTFDNWKNESALTELDKFFKIDLASKYKDVEYIIEVLKEGETLYVHRALKKCDWIYSDDYADFINPQFLDNNIFAVTSMRVKRLILKTVVMHIRKEERAVEFFNYCIKIKLNDIALKCILFTSEEFKLSLMQNQNSILFKEMKKKKISYIRFIIGKSFKLLDAFINMLENCRGGKLLKFSYLYPEDNIEYLELFEKYVNVGVDYDPYVVKLPKEICEHAIKHYKDRVLAKPVFYLSTMHESIIVRHITTEDAKIFIAALFPVSAESFWYSNIRERTKAFLNLVPHSQIYDLLKKLFNEKYPNDEFETFASFYHQGFYVYMTEKQQEEWALNHLKSEKQILGVGNDYLWYQFINFKTAFEEIKKYVIFTKEPGKRELIVNTVIKSVRDNRDLELYFKYYISRHINEADPVKESFLNEVIEHQNVFNFDEACWENFYTIVLSLDIYHASEESSFRYSIENYKLVALFYHILHEKNMPENLMTYLVDVFNPKVISNYSLLEKLTEVKKRFLFNYLHTFFSNLIMEYKNKPFTNTGKIKTERFFKVIVKLVKVFNVHTDKVVKERYIPCKRERPDHDALSDARLLQELKKDKILVLSKLPYIEHNLQKHLALEINNFLKKIKIYFPYDVAESYRALFKNLISENSESLHIDTCINGIFKLSNNEQEKLELMQEYAPKNAIVNHDDDDDDENDDHNDQSVYIRRAICRYASSSLPPIPLPNMLSYLKGDCARFCLHIFSIYVAALPMTKCVELVHSVLDTPVSIQKHALRLAVKCFKADVFKDVIADIWNKTKNVTLRGVIYKGLFNRILDSNEKMLYDSLISLTLDLNEDDLNVVFALVNNNELPNDLLGDYKKATWKAMSAFKDKEPNISRKRKVINGIRDNLKLMDRDFVKTIIDEHLNNMFEENQLDLNYTEEDIASLYVAKWNLTVHYIIFCSCDGDNPTKYVDLAKDIIKKCLSMWNERPSGNCIYQHCCWDFIKKLNTKSIECDSHSEYLIPIYEAILDVLEAVLPLHKMYMSKWDMQLVIANRQVIKSNRLLFNRDEKHEIIKKSAKIFGERVVELVSDHVNNKTYFTSHSEKIRNSIRKRVEEILKVIFSSSEDYAEWLNSALVDVAGALLECKTMETFLLAIHLLPADIADNSDDDLLERLQVVSDIVLTCAYPEVQSAAHQKFYKPFVRVYKKPQGRDASSLPKTQQRFRRPRRRRNR